MTVHDLPAVNASLNALSGVLLLAGYALIRARRIEQHRRCMIAAFVDLVGSSSSATSCITHRWDRCRSRDRDSCRPLYFTILITHVTLAATVPPLALVTLSRGLKGRYPQHVRIARWTFPIWLYVSVTGVLVYVLLYQPTWLL